MTKLHLDGKKNNFYGQKIELRLWRDITFKECEFCLLSNFRNGDISQTVAQLRVFKLFQTLLLYQWIWKQLESSLILKESCFFAHSIMNIKGVLNWTAWFDYSSTVVAWLLITEVQGIWVLVRGEGWRMQGWSLMGPIHLLLCIGLSN